ncbi:GNAT family N-acetyltransferase [Bacillus sp. SM2101]|uniref:GNAT family N-acetyltransferase n=1 Tax=Bacillus sp. SM2101 TaxID=2805366 RepID=UPI001BDF2E10
MKIRKAVLKDVKSIAKVHVDSWKTTYKHIVPDEYLNKLSYKSREQLWEEIVPSGNVYVAENNQGQIVGFANGGRERSRQYDGYEGELYAIYLLQEYQGCGIGKQLIMPIIEHLKQLKIHSMVVFVLEDNSACQFYEALGGKKMDSLEIVIAGKKLNEVVYGWSDISYILS